jgi:NAD(P)-dependent dehydrogenase (short-subunit alcohol dehydrogenase family)
MASVLDRFRLDGQMAVITGGARGIGRATAEAFVAAGARAVLIDLDLEEAKKAALALGNAEAHSLNVTLEAEVDRFFDELAERLGRIDVLVNNAGASIRKPTTELSAAEWDKVIAVNQTAVFLCSRAAARHMLPRKSGTIVNLASIMGSSGGGLYPNISYQASKGAVVNMTRAMAIEWAKDGIRVNAVAPAWVRTHFGEARGCVADRSRDADGPAGRARGGRRRDPLSRQPGGLDDHRACARDRRRVPGAVAHDPEKWVPVFGIRSCEKKL